MNGRGSKLDGPGRLRIIDECRKSSDKLLEDAQQLADRFRRRKRPNITAVAKQLGLERRTVQLWWDRRHQLDVSGHCVARWEGNSGRPTHAAFATEKKIEEAIDVCVKLPPGGHTRDAAKKLMCSQKTLYTHTHERMNWRWPPTEQVGADTPNVRKRRLEFVDSVLTPTGRAKKKFKTATWLDHKWGSEFGLNRSHQRQARR